MNKSESKAESLTRFFVIYKRWAFKKISSHVYTILQLI